MLKFARKTQQFTRDQKLLFYGALSHELTVFIRIIHSEHEMLEEHKLQKIGTVNRLLHATSGQICSLLAGKAWTEEDSEHDFNHWTSLLVDDDDESYLKGSIKRALKKAKSLK